MYNLIIFTSGLLFLNYLVSLRLGGEISDYFTVIGRMDNIYKDVKSLFNKCLLYMYNFKIYMNISIP